MLLCVHARLGKFEGGWRSVPLVGASMHIAAIRMPMFCLIGVQLLSRVCLETCSVDGGGHSIHVAINKGFHWWVDGWW